METRSAVVILGLPKTVDHPSVLSGLTEPVSTLLPKLNRTGALMRLEEHCARFRRKMLRQAKVLVATVYLGLGGYSDARSRVEVTIHVSPSGDDHNDGSSPVQTGKRVGPLRSLLKAKNVVRQMRLRRDKVGKVTIALAGGVYHLTSALTLDERDSGFKDAPLVFEPEEASEIPVISGGVSIDNWRLDEHGLVTSWPTKCPSQLFVNGRRVSRPRLPAAGVFNVAAVHRGTGASRVRGPDDIIARAGDVSTALVGRPGVEVVVIAAWTASRLHLTGYDPTTRRISLRGSFAGHGTHPYIETGMPYYLDNVGGELEPGSWRCDLEKGELRYRPLPGENGRIKAVVPAVSQLLHVRGTLTAPAHNIVFRGIAFEHASWTLPVSGWGAMQAEVGLPHAVEVENCQAIIFDGITIRHSGAGGIRIGKGCSDVKLKDSEIFDMGGGGVSVGSSQRKPKLGSDWEGGLIGAAETHSILITGNRIRALGRIQHAGVGVWSGQAHHVRITKNEIADLFYSGISLGWVWNTGPSLSHDNVVSDNIISHFGQGLLSDFGGIYTLGRQDRTVVTRNLIKDGRSSEYGGQGIYADEGSSGIVFSRNKVDGVSDAGIQIAGGGNVWFVDNVLNGTQGTAIYCNRAVRDRVVHLSGNGATLPVGVPATRGFCSHPSVVISRLRLNRAGRKYIIDKPLGIVGVGADYGPAQK